MFNNIGGKIKVVAKIIFGLEVAIGIIVGIGAFSNGEVGAGIAILICFAIFGYVSAILVHGFGNLVQNTDYIKHNLETSQNAANNDAANISQEKANEEMEQNKLRSQNLSEAEIKFELGKKYFHGDGFKQSYVKAVEWFQKSADEGSTKAMNNLGICYLTGNGVAKDTKIATQLFEKASNLGNAAAMCNFAFRLELGDGIEQDKNEAIKWYKKAADLGNEKAKAYLSKMYVE